MATFSVIVPVYNAAHTIERCVASIAASGGGDVQIILIEDCSKDNSLAVCRKLEREYDQVLCLHNERNRGVSHTRNRGVDAATGEYLLFADSDDWVEPEWADKLLYEICRDPRWMPVCGFRVEDERESEPPFRVWSGESAAQQVMLKQAFDLMDKVLLQQLWTKAFRRDIIERHHIRFDETQNMGEDLQFILDYLEAADLLGFTMINQPLYHYRSDSCGLMSRFGIANREEEYKRVLQLGRITGEEKRCHDTLKTLKKVQVYHILRSDLRPSKKRRLAREILGDEASSYCREQRIIMLKEQILRLCGKYVKGKVAK